MTWKPSPNFTKGRGSHKVEFLVMHWIVGRIAAADAVFAKANGTSGHYAVDDNKVHQYVKEEDTAWHAGQFIINQKSIGIEHAGGPSIPITDATYETSSQLIAGIWQRHGRLPLRKHSEFRPTQCPGTLDLARLERRANDILSPTPPTIDYPAVLIIRDATIADLTKKLGEANFELGIAVNSIDVLKRGAKKLEDRLTKSQDVEVKLQEALDICIDHPQIITKLPDTASLPLATRIKLGLNIIFGVKE